MLSCTVRVRIVAAWADVREARLSSIKLIDFGSAHTKCDVTYSYIQSRFYRAPEVMLGYPCSCGASCQFFHARRTAHAHAKANVRAVAAADSH